MDANIKEYLAYVEETLMRKYDLNQDLSQKIIQASYLFPSIIDYPEECLHEDIEGVADNIYQDYMEGRL